MPSQNHPSFQQLSAVERTRLLNGLRINTLFTRCAGQLKFRWILAPLWQRQTERGRSTLTKYVRIKTGFSRGVAQPGSAPALGADRPTPTVPFPTLTSLCFQ
jgi:hypothetical protein